MINQAGGKNWVVDADSINIFDLKGSLMGKYWAIGIEFGGPYIMTQVEPVPASGKVLDMIMMDIQEGNYNQVHMVVASNRIAVRLFLEGVLTQRNFQAAIEGYSLGEPFLYLPEFTVGEHTLALGILPETLVGAGYIATVDRNFHIVGDDDGRYTAALALPDATSFVAETQAREAVVVSIT